MRSKLTRSRNDRVFSGVCGGLARYTGLDVTIVRFLFVLGLLFFGFTPIVYLALWVLMPEEEGLSSIVESAKDTVE